jgi:D-alanyl-D-alanine carboxypeptidase/D-alanyl-D-alanine-endopeptidase (penicillin-binding protein 4)
MLNGSSDWKDASTIISAKLRIELTKSRRGQTLSALCLTYRSDRAAAVGVALEPAPATLSGRIQHLLEQPKWESSFWGLHIVSLKDGAVLFSLNGRRRFLPASNMKLLIGAAALDLLGPNFRFETPVFAQGPIGSEGRLLGSLVLVGSGGPNLEGRFYNVDREELPLADMPPFLLNLADQLVAHGLKSILGDVSRR